MIYMGSSDLSTVEDQDLRRLIDNSEELNAKAMLLTDAWGAMFILDVETVKTTTATLGMPAYLGQKFYDTVSSVSVVNTWGMTDGPSDPKVFTWHLLAASILTVCGATDLGQAMDWVSDDTIDEIVDENAELLGRTIALQPDYASYLLFSPQVAARVLGVFGATATPGKLLEVARRVGVITAEDAEGRQGIACKFARSLALVLASKGGNVVRARPRKAA